MTPLPATRLLPVLLLLLTASPAAAGYAEAVAFYGRADYAAAAREFAALAQQGDAESQYMLARLLQQGDGVPRDLVAAWRWFDAAARQGHKQAAQARDGMIGFMTAQQLVAAQGGAAPVPAAPAAPVLAPPVLVPPVVAPPQPAAGRQTVVVAGGTVVAASPPLARAAAPPGRGYAGRDYERLVAVAGGLGEQLRLVQRELNKAGYFAGPLDGRAGPLTRGALRAYQRDHGMIADGQLSAEVLDALTRPPPNTIVTVRVPEQQAAREIPGAGQ
ncbi:MAG: peptidoglycan-binding protein [Magnetospirillum sp.]|nr:peptidoglycan-binding protein [Magnetospirillum sp.]